MRILLIYPSSANFSFCMRFKIFPGNSSKIILVTPYSPISQNRIIGKLRMSRKHKFTVTQFIPDHTRKFQIIIIFHRIVFIHPYHNKQYI